MLNKEFKHLYKYTPAPGTDYAETVDEANSLFEKGGDKHPEKRVGKVWRGYVSKNLKGLKMMFPNMKRSQHLNILWKKFKNSSENPMNREDNFKWKKGKKSG